MKKKIISCFDIGEVPRSPGKWNWNWLYFLPFIYTFEQGALLQIKTIFFHKKISYDLNLMIEIESLSWNVLIFS